MSRLSRFLSPLVGGLGVAIVAASPVSAATLTAELKTDFFQFFNLASSCDPIAVGNGTWHCFRPTGPAFHALVEVDVLTDGQDRILASRLGIDRAFVDSRRNGVFARDIAKTYLGWAVPTSPGDVAILAYNIGDVSQAGGQVIMRSDAVKPVPEDTTGGYAVYLGKVDKIALRRSGFTLSLVNVAGALPPQHVFAGPDTATPAAPDKRWLYLDVVLDK